MPLLRTATQITSHTNVHTVHDVGWRALLTNFIATRWVSDMGMNAMILLELVVWVQKKRCRANT